MNLGQIIGSHVRDAVRQPEPRWNLIGHTIGSWTIEWVRVTTERFDPIRYEVWQTQDDERTCPVCGQLNGHVWQQGEGFEPPAHDNCRCERVYHHTEFNVRLIEEWQQRQVWTTSIDYRWQRTQ